MTTTAATTNPVVSMYKWVLLAVCLWREARGCSHAAKVAIAHVICNRATDPRQRFPKTIAGVITAPSQFSSISPPHSNSLSLNEWINATAWPTENDQHWLDCCSIADAVGTATDGVDPTGGATNYYSVPIPEVPSWADPSKLTLTLEAFRFFKL